MTNVTNLWLRYDQDLTNAMVKSSSDQVFLVRVLSVDDFNTDLMKQFHTGTYYFTFSVIFLTIDDMLTSVMLRSASDGNTVVTSTSGCCVVTTSSLLCSSVVVSSTAIAVVAGAGAWVVAVAASLRRLIVCIVFTSPKSIFVH